MRRTGWLAVMLWITVIGFAGCGKEKTEQVEITLIHGWGTMEPDHVTMRRIYKDFEKENPDIRLNLVSMPSTDEVISKANDMMAVGKIPDLIFLGGDGRDDIYQFVEQKGYAVDMMPYIREDSDFASDLSPELLAYWTTKDNRLYTISDVLLLSGGYWYNEDLFQAAGISEIPRSWDEFFDICDRLDVYADEKGIDLTPIQINPENSIYLLDVFLAEQGSHPPAVSWNSFQAALGMMERVYHYGGGLADEYSYRDVLGLFNEGRSAMYINGIWASPMIDEKLKVRYAAFPYQNGDTISCVSACLGYLVGDTKDERKIEASVRFVKYMVSDPVQKRILLETQQMPSNPNIRLEEFQDQMPRFYQAAEEVLQSKQKMEVPDNVWGGTKINLLKEKIMSLMDGTYPRRKLFEQIQ